MILLKRLNGMAFYLNSDLIEQIESAPDTVITLTTGNNIVVLEKAAEVVEKCIEYKKRIQEEQDIKDHSLQAKFRVC